MASDPKPVLRRIRTSTPIDWPRVFLFFGILTLALTGFGYAWSGHFASGFHLEDTNVIVNNRSIREFSEVGHFFTDPRAFSARQGGAAWAPLLPTLFSLDYQLAGRRPDPLLFQIESFVWFCLQLLLIYIVFRLIPWPDGRRGRDVSHYSGLLAALLYGLHPLAAETVNYALERGEILAAIGVLAGLALWIAWPRRLPEDFLIKIPRVPKTDWDSFKRHMQPRVSRWYRAVRNFPFPLYLIPVTLGMLASPAAASFAPILLAWLLLFEPERGARKAAPALVFCGGFWIFQSAWSWRIAGPPNISAPNFWITQPWAIVHYFYSFVIPIRLSSTANLRPFDAPWSPLALAGYVGLAAFVWLAATLARRQRWKGVSFGLWWFLIAAVQEALIPRMNVEAYPRAWIACIGLTFAAVCVVRIFAGQYLHAPRGENGITRAHVAVPVLLALALAALGWQTWGRNRVWRSDETLWNDIIAKNPGDGYALMNYGLVLMSAPGADLFNVRHQAALEQLKQAQKLLPRDAAVETNLALATEYFGLGAETEGHYMRAISLQPGYEPAYAHYARWLIAHGQPGKGREMAFRAEQLDPRDLIAHAALADYYLSQNNSDKANQEALATLAIDPGDPDALRARNVAATGMKMVSDAQNRAKSSPTVTNYLQAALLDFENNRFEDSIEADRAALKLRPDLVEAWINMATTYYALGRTDDTIAALREAQKLRPDLPLVKHDLEYMLAQKARQH